MLTDTKISLQPALFYKMLRTVFLLVVLRLSPTYCMNDVIKELLTPLKGMGEACGYASCTEPVKGVLNIHIVPHTHGDLGQTQTFYSYYTGDDEIFEPTTKNMKQILDYTISELWSSTHRKFTFSDMAYFFYWWAHRDETVRRMVYELLRQGRLNFVGGGWSMSDESTTSYHAIIDHFTYTLRKINSSFLDCGRPLVAWQTDAVGHSREFASLMAQMGYDGLFLAPIGFDDEVSRIHRKEMEFVWRGSDDLGPESDIFSHILFDGMLPPPGFCFSSYCSDPLLISSTFTFSNIIDRTMEFVNSMRYRQSPYYSTDNVLVMMGGRLAYSDASMWFENIDKLIQVINMMSANISAHAFYSTPACYLKAVYDKNPTLRSKQDDFYPQALDKTSYTSGGYTTRPSLKYLAREAHRYLQIAKQLHVTAQLGDYAQFFEDFHWIYGVFQDHQVITGSLWPRVKNFYVKRMDIMIQQSILLFQDGFNKLRQSSIATRYFRCQFNITKCINTSGPQPFIVVYNPLAWPVTITIRLPVPDRQFVVYSPKLERVEAATMPVPRPVLQIPGRDSLLETELIFIAKDLPPMGFRSYYYRSRALGWERPKRSLIKKINQKKPKKYLVRQTNAAPEDETLLEPEYEYFDDNIATTTPHETKTKIVFGNVSRLGNESDLSDVLTPKSRVTTTDLPKTTDRVESGEELTGNMENLTTYVEVATVGNVTDDSMDGNYNTVPVTTTSSTTRSPTTTIKATRTTTALPTTTTESSPYGEDANELKLWHGYEYFNSSVPFIRNKYVRVNLESFLIKNISIANGIKMPFDIQMFYYVSDDPVRLGKKDVAAPGAYVFRSMDNKQERILDSVDTKVFKSRLSQEIHCVLSPYASFVLRLYSGSSVLEVDWLVGPIPVEDGLGKDVFIKYVTNLDNKGVFYTDSNGRQTIKRIRNRRPTYDTINKDPVAGNIYPVTSKIYIEDVERNIRFSVLNDRAQGGSSLKDGEIDIMLHRRLLTEDPIKENLNDTEFGKGVVIRGTHYIYISRANYKPTKVFEKKLAKEIELRPQIFVSSSTSYGPNTKNIWSGQTNEFSALKTKLPIGLHILTLEKWPPKTLLLRLENYLEKSDAVLTGVKTVQLNDIFKNLTFESVKEMTLGANVLLKDWTPLDWKKQLFYSNFNDAYGNWTEEFSEDNIRGLEDVELDKPIILGPQQIRTFLLTYTFKET